MLTFHNPDHHLHHASELKDGKVSPCFELPHRADTVLARVRQVGLGQLAIPAHYGKERYARIHSERYVNFLESAWQEWTALGHSHDALPLVWPVRDLRSDIEPEHIDGKLGFYAMDAGVAITAGTWQAVRRSADTALNGMDHLLQGNRSAFALCRPPGHHAAAEYMGGYCYLNNAAIAAQSCLDQGGKRVAILDVDFHHGNGTQSIFYQRPDVLFVSLHGDPRRSYPYFSGHRDETGSGAGQGFNVNYPLPHGTDWGSYATALDDACKRIRAYQPDALVISLGVDTYENDPISHFRLTSHDFFGIGAAIASIQSPTLFVMEGGYMVDEIGINAVNVLQGYTGGV